MEMEYEAVIGLEVHVHLATRTKMFCGCAVTFGAEPNTAVCPVCLGLPGALPVLNRRAVEMAVRTALALSCEVKKVSLFARKNYFYPDLPKGYQISQYERPLAKDGHLRMPAEGVEKMVRITRLHLEEDAGKLIHHEEGASLLDFNRCGIPLMEIVTGPDLRSPGEASAFLKELRNILLYLQVSECDMEKGNMRCDANLSIRNRGTSSLGTKTEIKNINSFRFLERALAFEMERQTELIRQGEMVVPETRLFDASSGKTFSMRGKEEAEDYRYFPEPDLPPLVLSEEVIRKERESLPELPTPRAERFVKDYGLPPYDARILTSDRSLADYFERCTALFPKPKMVANFVMTELLKELNREGKDASRSPVSPEALARILGLVERRTISMTAAKQVFAEVYATGMAPEEVVREKGLSQVDDTEILSRTVEEVLADNQAKVEEYKKGRKGLLGFFVGEAMKRTRGKGDPKLISELLKKNLGD